MGLAFSRRTLLHLPPFPVAALEYFLPCKLCSGCRLGVLAPSLSGKTPTYSIQAYAILSLSWLPDYSHLKKIIPAFLFLYTSILPYDVICVAYPSVLGVPKIITLMVMILTAQRCKAKLSKGKGVWAKSRVNQAQTFRGDFESGVTEYVLRSPSKELFQHVWNVVYQGSSSAAEGPGF